VLSVLLASPLEPVPLLELTALGGERLEVDLTERVTVVDFFATWCPRCRASLGAHDQLVAAFGDRLRIVVVDVEEPAAVVRSFFSRHPLPPEVLLARDPTGAVMHAFGQHGFPAFCVIDRTGKVRHVVRGWGAGSLASLREGVAYLLDGAKAAARPVSAASRRRPGRAKAPRRDPPPAASVHDERARRMGVEVLR
jgi:thiol-disulfide isomerase/thioredoxin